jgi:hypothetical protein
MTEGVHCTPAPVRRWSPLADALRLSGLRLCTRAAIDTSPGCAALIRATALRSCGDRHHSRMRCAYPGYDSVLVRRWSPPPGCAALIRATALCSCGDGHLPPDALRLSGLRLCARAAIDTSPRMRFAYPGYDSVFVRRSTPPPRMSCAYPGYGSALARPADAKPEGPVYHGQLLSSFYPQGRI